MTDKDKYAQTPLFKMPEWHPVKSVPDNGRLRLKQAQNVGEWNEIREYEVLPKSTSFSKSRWREASGVSAEEAAAALNRAAKFGGASYKNLVFDEMTEWKCSEPITSRFFQSLVAIAAIGGTAALCWLLTKAFP